MENKIEEDKKIEDRKEKIKNWLKNPYNLALVGIFIFLFLIRLYYFYLTKNQPLWWDEAEYMSTAKSFAGIIPVVYHLALNRFPGFPLLASLFYMVGINNEVVLRFLLTFIPSIIAVVLMYIVLVSMYPDKRIALASTLIFSVLWEHVFYSNRFHTENLSLIFEFLAIIILFRVYLRNKNLYFFKTKYALLWISLFSILSIIFRSANMVFIPVMAIFLIIVNLYNLPRKSRFYSTIGLIVLILAGFILTHFLAQKYAFVNQFYHYESPIYWGALSVFYGYYQSLIPFLPSILFYAFLLGVITIIYGLVIFPEGLSRLSKKTEDSQYKANIFNLILILGFLFFFIFMLRPGGLEYRWFFAFLPGMFAFTTFGLIKLGDFCQFLFKIKHLSVFLILILLFLGGYTQFNHADMIVRNKLDSYSQVKDSGFWMKENSNLQDIIISGSIFQHAYYSERKVESFPQNESDFNKIIEESKPRYIVISAFQPLPQWTYEWPNKNPDKVAPVKAYFADSEKKQPLLIVYEFKKT